MTGIVGRLFREFAITLSVAVAASAIVSLSLTPMMCARFLKPIQPRKGLNIFDWSERIFEAVLDFYKQGLRWVLNHRLPTLMLAILTLAGTIYLYLVIPKGLFPQEDTGEILGVTEAAQNISFQAMMEHQRAVSDLIGQDPDVQSVAGFVGPGTVNATVNTGRLYIVLKPRDRRKASAGQVIARLRKSTKDLPGVSLFAQPAQDLQIDSRVSRNQYQ
jgi:multidrug efflux pump